MSDTTNEKEAVTTPVPAPASEEPAPRRNILDPITEKEAYRQAAQNNVSPELTKALLKNRYLIVGVGAVALTAVCCLALGVALGASKAGELSQGSRSGLSWSDQSYPGYGMSDEESRAYEAFKDGYGEGYHNGVRDGQSSGRIDVYPYDAYGMTAEPGGILSDDSGSVPSDAGTKAE